MMSKEISSAAVVSEQSLLPLTQALVGALEIALDEVAALRNHEAGPWADALEAMILQSAAGLAGTGANADSIQVAHSALRACFRTMRAQLH
ncbi:MAG: hypothetical protein JWL62_1076 [Hyphomicrobiales bacterium]|nr:hypothetical protein [Hyphomicrobiales bacterium]